MSTVSQRVTPADVADIFNLAADLIEERGHWKGWYCGPKGELCLRGAVIAAVDPNLPLELQAVSAGLPREAYVALCAIGQYLHRTRTAVSSAFWNDMPERTKADVVSALREAARAET